VNDAELNLSGREQSLGDREQAGEVVLDHHQDAPESALDEPAEDEFPVFEVFPPESTEAGQDPFLTVSPETHGHVDTGRSQPLALAQFDVLAVDEKSEQVGVERTGVAEVELLDEFAGDQVEVLLGSGEAESAEGSLSGIDRTARGKQAEQQRLSFLGEVTLIGWRKHRGSEVSATGAGNAELKRDASQPKGTAVGAVGLVPGHPREKGAALGLAQGLEAERQELSEVEITEAGGDGSLDLGLRGLAHDQLG
jgi:hypothetical protein